MAVSVQVIGRLAADAEVKTSKNGNQFVAFRMATDEYKNGNRETAWLNVTTNDDRSLKISQFLTKGRLIAIYGTETVSIYMDRNGVPQVSRDIRAERVEFISTGQQQTNEQTVTQQVTQVANQHTTVQNTQVADNFPPMDCGTLRPQPQMAVQQPQQVAQPQFASQATDEEDDLPF